jgi:hypothetical protein
VRAGAALALAALLALILLWAWPSKERGAVLDMPASERAALLDRTIENLKTVCAGPGGLRLSDFCREQAELILKLPECDAACVALAKQHLAQPSR